MMQEHTSPTWHAIHSTAEWQNVQTALSHAVDKTTLTWYINSAIKGTLFVPPIQDNVVVERVHWVGRDMCTLAPHRAMILHIV